ncbi:MAG: hypothetical protein QME74_05870 [Candidatus Edwardsbacteria bacterium]|nr:hypothetical protein [Candidatus Edwardsbacteria bacterium]
MSGRGGPSKAITAVVLLALIAAFALYLGKQRGRFESSMDTRDRRQRAVAANNRALELSDQREFAAAAQLLEQAYRDYPGDSAIVKNLAFAYGDLCVESLSRGRCPDARAYIAKALAVRDSEAALWYLKAEVCNRMNLSDSAQDAIVKAQALGGMTPAVLERLERLKHELATQASFQSDYSGHFDIRFEGAENRAFAEKALIMLETIRDQAGRDLGWQVSGTTGVILYSDRQFADVTRLPAWTGAAFDGKIRMPMAGYRDDTTTLRAVLAHEFTHAVLFDMTGNRCPAWFSEGLAQLEQGRSPEPVYAPLDGLAGSFTTMSEDEAKQAYRASLSAVSFLTREHDMGFVRIMLEKIRNGQDFSAAFVATYDGTIAEFEERWKQSIAQ